MKTSLPWIEKLLPQKDAFALIKQMVDSEIRESGGREKAQKQINEHIKKFGKDFYNYLTPLYIRAYASNGITIPYKYNIHGPLKTRD